MTTETPMHADTPVSFTIELPQALAEQLIARAKTAGLSPETLVLKAVTRFLRPSNLHIPITQTLQKSEEVRAVIKDLIREELRKTAHPPKQQPAEQPAPNAAAIQELQRKLSMLKEERKLAGRRLCDIEHSVKLTAQKIEEYEKERQTLEEEQKTILDEISKYPDDRGLISSLDEIAEKLFTAKYNRGLMAAQHHDAVRCCAEMKKTVEMLETECSELGNELRRQEGDMQ